MSEQIMARIVESLAQFFLLLALAPLITGVIRTLKARLQTRRGPSIFQPYRDLYKLFQKGMVIPETASWIFAATPWVVFFSTILAGLMIPMVAADAPLGLFGGALAVIYLLGLGRFFLALSGLDTGSSFGGLGSSREMTISALAEPAMMMAIFTVAIGAGSTGLTEIAGAAIGQNWRFLAPAQMFAFAALALVLIAETGRIPVDNPATHLELTMIHEAMILEYSGRHLALIEWAANLKLFAYSCLGIALFFPFGIPEASDPASLAIAGAILIFKLAIGSFLLALIETLSAKMRIFRAPEFLGTAFLLAVLAMLVHLLLEAGQ